jgi:hypothetical protein
MKGQSAARRAEVLRAILLRASNVSGDEGTANQELPRKISKISKAFSAMITAAVNQASALLRKSNSIPLSSV